MSDEYAFPGPCQHEQRVDINEGMKLRDYFAAHALTGMLAYSQSDHNGNWTNNSSKSGVATEAYRFADEMLKARKTEE